MSGCLGVSLLLLFLGASVTDIRLAKIVDVGIGGVLSLLQSCGSPGPLRTTDHIG